MLIPDIVRLNFIYILTMEYRFQKFYETELRSTKGRQIETGLNLSQMKTTQLNMLVDGG